MKAVITVVGKDTVGILACVSSACSQQNINIVEVTQSILHDIFAMIMVVEISQAKVPCAQFSDMMDKLGKERGLVIHVMREDVFSAMHQI